MWGGLFDDLTHFDCTHFGTACFDTAQHRQCRPTPFHLERGNLEKSEFRLPSPVGEGLGMRSNLILRRIEEISL